VSPQGLCPTDAVTGGDVDYDKRFLAQTVVMTVNLTLSIPDALKREFPEDYDEKIATREWPLGLAASPFRSDVTRFPP
jgi:hypothetical protein